MPSVIPKLSLTRAREALEHLPEELAQPDNPGYVAITRRRKPVLAILSWDYFESLLETLEVLSDGEAMAAIWESEEEIAGGKTIPWNDVRRKLGLDQ